MFNIRVYGILIDENKNILVSDEFIRGMYVTKFPGGGLEPGEGTRECLRREFKEETNLDVTIGDHIYTTDFYQVSAFNANHQIISIYYYVYHPNPITLHTKTKKFDFAPSQTEDPKGEAEVFRWVSQNDFNEETVTLPIDKIVAKIIQQPKK